MNSTKLIKEGIRLYPDERFYSQMLVMNYLSKKDYVKAEESILPLLANEPQTIDYEIAVKIYFALKKYDLALKYLQKSYAVTNGENELEQIFYILFEVLDKRKEAISYLESHIALHGGSPKIYYRLIGAYGKEQNIEGILSTYKKLYIIDNSDDIANKILELYLYKKDRKSAIEFLEKTKHNYKALIDLYASEKNFDKIVTLCDKLYKESGNVDMLGYSTIYFYEANKDKLDKTLMREVIERFEKLLQRSDDAMYLNYYGYLLIDHNIDYKKGISFIKKALEKEPESLSYLDSLAWGYYKIGECEKSYKMFDELRKKTTEVEILMHYNEVKKCKENSK